MSTVLYRIVYGIMYFFSLLPMRVLYILSDLVYFILYYVIGYRRKVVRDNLKIAFPFKSEEKLKEVEKKFYENFSDSFFELLKMLSESQENLEKKVKIDFSILDELFSQGKSCQFFAGHFFNWEYIGLFPKHIPVPCLCVYKTLSNDIMDRLMRKLRSRLGTILIPQDAMARHFVKFRNKAHVLSLIGDQNPGDPANSFWVKLFGHPVPFLKGPEKAPQLSNLPIYFVNIQKKGRGRYDIDLILIEDNPNGLKEGDLTLKIVNILEEKIKESPDLWLWSHKRFKHVYKPEYGPILE